MLRGGACSARRSLIRPSHPPRAPLRSPRTPLHPPAGLRAHGGHRGGHGADARGADPGRPGLFCRGYGGSDVELQRRLAHADFSGVGTRAAVDVLLVMLRLVVPLLMVPVLAVLALVELMLLLIVLTRLTISGALHQP